MEKKSLAAMLIAPKGPDMDDEDEGGEDGQDVAVNDMMDALQNNDVEGFKAALNAFIDMR